MLNVYELENRWKIYKLKSFIPHTIIVLSSMVIISLVVLFVIEDTVVTEKTKNEPITENVQKKEIIPTNNLSSVENKTPVVQTFEPTNITAVDESELPPTSAPRITTSDVAEKQRVILAPSLSFMKTIDRDSLPAYEETSPSPEEAMEENFSNEMNNVQETSQPVITPKTPTESTQPSTSISIQRKDTLNDLEQVVKRFEKNENPALSLFVAKKYYELGDYHKAYSYALRTNDLNSNIEESWIIFSKALVKLNEKEMAIKTLKQYIQHSNSNQAKILLDEINSGKFK